MKFQQIIDKRAESLAKMLLLQLKDTSLKKAQFQLVIQLLSRLQYENWVYYLFIYFIIIIFIIFIIIIIIIIIVIIILPP